MHPTKPGYYRVHIEGIQGGTKLDVKLPCGCLAPLTVPDALDSTLSIVFRPANSPAWNIKGCDECRSGPAPAAQPPAALAPHDLVPPIVQLPTTAGTAHPSPAPVWRLVAPAPSTLPKISITPGQRVELGRDTPGLHGTSYMSRRALELWCDTDGLALHSQRVGDSPVKILTPSSANRPGASLVMHESTQYSLTPGTEICVLRDNNEWLTLTVVQGNGVAAGSDAAPLAQAASGAAGQEGATTGPLPPFEFGRVDQFLRDAFASYLLEHGLSYDQHASFVPNPNATAGSVLRSRFEAARSSVAGPQSSGGSTRLGFHGTRLAFHGTPEPNLSSICEHGLDPTMRGSGTGQKLGPGEYCADKLGTALNYCRGGRIVLVFEVLVGATKIRTKPPPWGEILVVQSNTSGLPNLLPIGTLVLTAVSAARIGKLWAVSYQECRALSAVGCMGTGGKGGGGKGSGFKGGSDKAAMPSFPLATAESMPAFPLAPAESEDDRAALGRLVRTIDRGDVGDASEMYMQLEVVKDGGRPSFAFALGLALERQGMEVCAPPAPARICVRLRVRTALCVPVRPRSQGLFCIPAMALGRVAQPSAVSPTLSLAANPYPRRLPSQDEVLYSLFPGVAEEMHACRRQVLPSSSDRSGVAADSSSLGRGQGGSSSKPAEGAAPSSSSLGKRAMPGTLIGDVSASALCRRPRLAAEVSAPPAPRPRSLLEIASGSSSAAAAASAATAASSSSATVLAASISSACLWAVDFCALEANVTCIARLARLDEAPPVGIGAQLLSSEQLSQLQLSGGPADDPITWQPLNDEGEAVLRLPCATDAVQCIFNRSTLVRSLRLACCCPLCGTRYDLPGAQPTGTMVVRRDERDCDGHVGRGSLVIDYSFPPGVQSERDPQQGVGYMGRRTRCYYPDDPAGWRAIALLKTAFERGVLFRVGTSHTLGTENVVTFGGIHQKSRRHGGAAQHGWPDPTALQRLESECAVFGIHPPPTSSQEPSAPGPAACTGAVAS